VNFSLVPALLAALTVACHGSGASSTPTIPAPQTSTSQGPAATASPTQPALPASPPPTAGSVTASCVDGWSTPHQGSNAWNLPIKVIERSVDVRGPLRVVDMRMFVGPESPPSDKNYLKDIHRWYVKLFAKDDLSFQGRFLIEARRYGDGVAAVAPYDSRGFASPDWVGFQWDDGHPKKWSYPGLPGRWSGTAYDFVDGGQGLTIPGLPAEVTGCLDGT